jgi:hypothetical protein
MIIPFRINGKRFAKMTNFFPIVGEYYSITEGVGVLADAVFQGDNIVPCYGAGHARNGP